MNIKLHYCKAGRAHSPAGWWARYWWLLIIGSNNRRRPICIPMNIAISFTIYNMTTGPICIPIYIIVIVDVTITRRKQEIIFAPSRNPCPV